MTDTTYIPKAPCKKCGTSLRYKSNYGCAQCLRLSNRKYQADNRDALLVKKLEWAKRNPKKNAAQSIKWQAENKALAYEIQKRALKARWEEHYRPKGRANAAKRRAVLIRRTPVWADLKKIEEIYANCPPGMDVDHAIPLRGKNVSGLHVHFNLQYLPSSVNRSKGAKYEIV